MKNTKGILVTEQVVFLEVFTPHFKSFYSSNDNNVDSIQLGNYLSNIDLPVLSKDQTEDTVFRFVCQNRNAMLP